MRYDRVQHLRAYPRIECRDIRWGPYAHLVAIAPSDVSERDIVGLRDAGFDDGEILEINQVTSYFCYANRTVLGLGVSTAGDVIGLSPNNSADPDDWAHK